MSHGGLPPRRPDQIDAPTPRIPVPGARTTPIVNKPGTTVVVQDGGIPGALSASGSIGSGSTFTLVTAGTNVNGLKLWSASISSGASQGGGGPGSTFEVEDVISDTGGNQYLACEIGLASGVSGSQHNSVSQEQHGIQVPAGKALQLVNGGAGGTGATRRCSATVIYTVL